MKTYHGIALLGFCLLVFGPLVHQGNAQGEKTSNIVARPLKFMPKDPTDIFLIGGLSKVTTAKDASTLEKLVGKDAAKAFVAQADLNKETIVLVSWSTSGPPEGTLKHETVGTGKDRRLVFYVHAPNAKIRGQRARIGADFFAVPKGVTVTFAPTERN